MAYIPDISDFYDRSWERVKNLDILIIDSLRRAPHPAHAHLEKTLEWIEKLKPRKAYLTNMHNDLVMLAGVYPLRVMRGVYFTSKLSWLKAPKLSPNSGNRCIFVAMISYSSFELFSISFIMGRIYPYSPLDPVIIAILRMPI